MKHIDHTPYGKRQELIQHQAGPCAVGLVGTELSQPHPVLLRRPHALQVPAQRACLGFLSHPLQDMRRKAANPPAFSADSWKLDLHDGTDQRQGDVERVREVEFERKVH
eukprot:752267-Hanusia_phi.AAC.7